MDDIQLRAELSAIHSESFGWAVSCCRGGSTEAEDLLQSVYLKVLEGRARFHGRSSFKTWLFAVIRHAAADQRRRAWVRGWLLLRHARECEPPAPVLQPDESLQDVDLQARFAAALQALPVRQREALHLVFYQDLSVQEAATVMRISVGSARQHYQRGKARLRQLLGGLEALHES